MWYYESSGASQGPVDADEVRRLIGQERIVRSTRVWREGFQGWLPAEQTELVGSFGVPALPAGYSPTGMPQPYGNPAVTHPGYAVLNPYGYHYAGFWIRFAAIMLDLLIFVVVFSVLGGIVAAFAVGASRGLADQDTLTAAAGIGVAIVYLIAIIAAVLYFTLLTAGRWQGTVGKRICGIHVIRAGGGGRIGFGLALGRYFANIITSIIPFGIGYMMAGWTNQKKALHDMICDTRVIYGRL